MASLPARTTASFDAIKPVSSLVLLDNEFNQYVGAAGIFNGGTTGTKLLIKSSDAADPPVEIDQIGAGPLAEWKQNGSLKASIENDGDLLANGITGAAGVYTFGSIPVGPASNPTTANQLARKQYVDDKILPFNLTWSIADPSVFPLNDDNSGLQLFRVPAITGGFLSKIVIIRTDGSHTAGGSVTFKARIFNSTSIGSGVSFDDTNNAANTPYTEDFADVSISEGTFLLVVVSARSGTVSERNVHINVEGFRKPQ